MCYYLLTQKSVLNIHWKDWCWSWNSNTLATWYEELTYWKDPDAGKDWRQEKKGTTEDEMVGWHHQLDGHESGDSGGREAWHAAVHGVTKSQTRLSDGTEQPIHSVYVARKYRKIHELQRCIWPVIVTLLLLLLNPVRLFCDPINCSPPGSSVHEISQARIMEWVANFHLQGIFF